MGFLSKGAAANEQVDEAVNRIGQCGQTDTQASSDMAPAKFLIPLSDRFFLAPFHTNCTDKDELLLTHYTESSSQIWAV